jgi:hypothetical protein
VAPLLLWIEQGFVTDDAWKEGGRGKAEGPEIHFGKSGGHRYVHLRFLSAASPDER